MLIICSLFYISDFIIVFVFFIRFRFMLPGQLVNSDREAIPAGYFFLGFCFIGMLC